MILPLLVAIPAPNLPQGSVVLDSLRRVATIADGKGRVRLVVSFERGCTIDRLEIGGRGVLGTKTPGFTGLQIGTTWHTSQLSTSSPSYEVKGPRLVVKGLQYGSEEFKVVEDWTFVAQRDSVSWTIKRRYLNDATVEDSAMPLLPFETLDTWTGATLGTGGVAWPKLLDAPNATYGVHTDSATFWRRGLPDCLTLRIMSDQSRSIRFSRSPSGELWVAANANHDIQTPRYGKARFVRDRQNVWAPHRVHANEETVATLEIGAQDYAKVFGIGSFQGLNTAAVVDMINTIGRIGVIDQDLVGSNGWYSGYICTHEPWLARVGTALNDPAYQRSVAGFLDYARIHAVQPDGMVKSRWKYDAGDAKPGTYDPESGFYEAQWGRLMDSQSSYATNVADQFDATGDWEWLRAQKAACEKTLDYLLERDTAGDGLVEMANSLTSQRRSSDWLDIVWASYKNAFVNAQLYGALVKWSKLETLLGDAKKSKEYRERAAKLKASFNRPVSQGGFWNPEKGWYVFWRDKDGSVHGDNLTVPVNLTAIGEGICDDPVRKRRLLETIEERMEKESLLSWPACFESYAPGEGADDKFPTYENGDIFLAWAEYGVKVYADTSPDIATKYVRNIVHRYEQDGLAYQRYLRATGKGAGDDILANNVNVLTGLYRYIFGLQPKYNRLLIDPHPSRDLLGSQIRYRFRSHDLTLKLDKDGYAIEAGSLVLQSQAAFGIGFDKDKIAYFAGSSELPTLTIEIKGGKIEVPNWEKKKAWSLSGLSRTTVIRHTFHGLPPGQSFDVLADGKRVGTVSAQRPSLEISCRVRRETHLQLTSRATGRSLPQ